MKLELELNEVNAVLIALSRLPYAEVAPLIEKVKGQADEQLKEAPVEE